MLDSKVDVCSLTGFFIEEHNPLCVNYFGGFIFVRTGWNEPRDNVLAEPLEGLLIDCDGSSQIRGEISPHDLKFTKRYAGNGNQVKYAFRKNERGIWVGEYHFSDDLSVRGKAYARINLDWGGVSIAHSRDIGPEERAEGLIKQMVQEGMLKVVEDGEKGREVVIPL